MSRINYDRLRKFVAPEFVFGEGARFLVSHYVRNLDIHRPMLVTDAGVLAAGWPDDVAGTLAEAGFSHVLFRDITSNPKDDEVMAGAEVFRLKKCDAIIAVGGGSALDSAKGIGIISSNGGHIRDYEGIDRIPVPCPPLICIPTTAGSAADVSQFAIITDTQAKKKLAIVSKVLVPDISLIDPETTTTMPPSLTSATGLDALTHSVEALVSNAGSPITDLHALESVRLVRAHLAGAYQMPDHRQHRDGMMRASLHAGLAFSNASLGIVHSMAHSLGGWKDCAHGECNAILLPLAIDYNFEAAREQYARLAEEMGLVWDRSVPDALKTVLIDAVRRFSESVGIVHSLSNIGIQETDIPELALRAMEDPCLLTNPLMPDRKDMETLYARAL